jgi:hypothetical protein
VGGTGVSVGKGEGIGDGVKVVTTFLAVGLQAVRRANAPTPKSFNVPRSIGSGLGLIDIDYGVD